MLKQVEACRVEISHDPGEWWSRLMMLSGLFRFLTHRLVSTVLLIPANSPCH